LVGAEGFKTAPVFTKQKAAGATTIRVVSGTVCVIRARKNGDRSAIAPHGRRGIDVGLGGKDEYLGSRDGVQRVEVVVVGPKIDNARGTEANYQIVKT
jgi:hypothetical protein